MLPLLSVPTCLGGAAVLRLAAAPAAQLLGIAWPRSGQPRPLFAFYAKADSQNL